MKNRANQFLKMAWMLVMLATTFPALAQSGKITGQVKVDHEDEAFATVFLLDQSGNIVDRTQTDYDGNYWLADVPPGCYVVRANSLGDTSETHLVVTENRITQANISIVRLALPCIEYHDDIALRVVYWNWETSRQKLTQIMGDRSPYNLIAAMQGGVYQPDLGDALQSRGARTNTMTVYVDGQKLRGELQLPFAALSSVELLQGGIPAEYGDATGGIIDIKTLSFSAPEMPLHGGAYGHGTRDWAY